MDPPPPAEDSGRRASGRGGKVRNRLGMKNGSVPAPSWPRGSSLASLPVRPPPSISAPPAPPSMLPVLPAGAPTPTPGPIPAAPTVPPRPQQGTGWGAMPPNFPSQHGNQQAPNPWGYPPATPEAAKQGTSINEPVNIDQVDNNEANRPAKKRYWTPEEEERLASSWLNASKDPIKGNDKKGGTFWKEVTDEFNKNGNGKHTREMNQLKIHWSRLKALITEFNGFWTKVLI